MQAATHLTRRTLRRATHEQRACHTPRLRHAGGLEVSTGAFALGSSADGAVTTLLAGTSIMDAEAGLSFDTRGGMPIIAAGALTKEKGAGARFTFSG